MKQLAWITIIAFITLLALPALAQRGGARGELLQGKVLQTGGQVRLALSIKVDSPDAPGKVPDDMAAKAAELEALAKAKPGRATQLLKLANEMRCFREVEQTVNADTPIIGVTTTSLDRVTVGTRLGMVVSADGKTDTIPNTVKLTKVAVQVLTDTSLVRTLPRGPRDGKTFYDVVGKVTKVSPLTLDINGTSVTVENPSGHQYLAVNQLSPRDLKIGQSVWARAVVRTGAKVDRVIRIIVSDMEIPSDPYEKTE